jgi:hypothetical protein
VGGMLEDKKEPTRKWTYEPSRCSLKMRSNDLQSSNTVYS